MDRDDRAVFDIIRILAEDGDAKDLARHLESRKNELDVTALCNSDGFTALTFAASQSKLSACMCLIAFVKKQEEKLA